MRSPIVWPAVPLVRTMRPLTLLQGPSHLCIFVTLTIMTMTNIRRAFLAALAAAAMASINSCEKPDNGSESTTPVEKSNYFVYDGYSFDINSVVKYDQGDSSVELWLSPMTGATTIAEIEREGDYVVINTNKAYLGKRDRFSEGTSKNSYIRFGENHKFAYGDAGTAYIQAAVEGDILTLDFLAQNLYTKAAEVKAALSGSYKGAFTTQTEHPYNNEWGINRNRETLTGAVYTTYEDGSNSSVTLMAGTSEAFKLTLAPSLVGKTIALPYSGSSSNLKLTYSGAIDFSLTKATGSISTSFNNGELEVKIDITNGDKRFRGNYKGAYEDNTVKLNRYVFNYGGTSLAGNGTYEIVKLMVENNGTQCKFFFSPSEGFSIAGSNSTHMPILTVPSSLINAGKKNFNDLKDWKFEFVEMQVWPFEDEYRPHPASTDWIEVNKTGTTYEVELVLSSIATGMPEGNIDVYYNGPAK